MCPVPTWCVITRAWKPTFGSPTTYFTVNTRLYYLSILLIQFRHAISQCPAERRYVLTTIPCITYYLPSHRLYISVVVYAYACSRTASYPSHYLENEDYLLLSDSLSQHYCQETKRSPPFSQTMSHSHLWSMLMLAFLSDLSRSSPVFAPDPGTLYLRYAPYDKFATMDLHYTSTATALTMMRLATSWLPLSMRLDQLSARIPEHRQVRAIGPCCAILMICGIAHVHWGIMYSTIRAQSSSER